MMPSTITPCSILSINSKHAIPTHQTRSTVLHHGKGNSQVSHIGVLHSVQDSSTKQPTNQQTWKTVHFSLYYSFLNKAYRLHSSHRKKNVLPKEQQYTIIQSTVKLLCMLTIWEKFNLIKKNSAWRSRILKGLWSHTYNRSAIKDALPQDIFQFSRSRLGCCRNKSRYHWLEEWYLPFK